MLWALGDVLLYLTPGGDPMRQRREAMSGTAAPKGLRKRLSGRMSLLVSALSLMVFFGSAQAASAWHLTSVSPTSGCPGNRSHIHRDLVQRVIDESSVERPDLAALHVAGNDRESHEQHESHGDRPALLPDRRLWCGNRYVSTSATPWRSPSTSSRTASKAGADDRSDRRDRRDRPSRSDRSNRPDR